MAQPNYSFYDGFDELNLSKWGHLWVEMTPVAIRNGIPNPGPADKGWKYEYWTWIKNRIKELDSKPRRVAGETKISRSLLMEIAKSDEYAAQVKMLPKLKARPLFLFPEERPNRGWQGPDATIDAEAECRRSLVKQMQDGPQVKPKPDYCREARVGKNAFNRAWANALVDSQNPNDWGKSGRRPKNLGP